MAGSIRRRGDDAWQIQISAGTDPATGKRRRVYRTVHGSRSDAEHALQQMMLSASSALSSALRPAVVDAVQTGRGGGTDNTGDVVGTGGIDDAGDAGAARSGRMPLQDYLNEWLELRVVALSPTTVAWYRFVINKHIVPGLGHIPIDELRPWHIQRLYADKLRPQASGSSSVSRSTVRCIHRILHAALSQAVRLQIVERNPCDAVDAPKSGRRPPRFWKPEEAARFLSAIRDDRLFALFHLALGTGLRRGELLGLRWRDVDLEHCSLTVRRVRVRAGRVTIDKEPKTSGSCRTIALPSQVCESLMRHAEAQLMEKELMGDAYQDHNLVFAGIDGKPLNPDYIGCQYFRRLISLANVPHINFHGLRHTHATLLAAEGVPLKTVSARLGHSSVKVTGDIYSHVLDRMDRQAADEFDLAMSRAASDQSVLHRDRP